VTVSRVGQTRNRVQIGDIFEIPVGAGLHVYGQVLAKDLRTYLVVAFRPVDTEFVENEFVPQDVRLAGIVFDAKLINGDWPLIAKIPVVRHSEPLFVSGHDALDGAELVSFDRRTRRPVKPAEAAKHGHRNLASPMLFQQAAQALSGRRDWEASFDHFRRLAGELISASPIR